MDIIYFSFNVFILKRSQCFKLLELLKSFKVILIMILILKISPRETN